MTQSSQHIAEQMTLNDFIWVAWIIAILAWFATYYTNRGMQKRLEIHRLMDKFSDQVVRIEDLAIDYWFRGASDVDYIQITIALKRLSNISMSISKLDNTLQLPQHGIVNLRKAVTRHDSRNIPLERQLIPEVVVASTELQQYYEKSF